MLRFPKLRLVMTGIFAFVWWFFFYPELCFPEDTCTIIYQSETYDMETWQENYQDISQQLLHADGENIIVKSRMLEYWKQSKEELLRNGE